MLGKLLNKRYQIDQILSAGEFCQTYLAQDQRAPNSPNCIIKHLLHKTSSYSKSLPNLQHLFTREIEALEKLDGYNRVPRLLDSFEEDNEFYLVQELVEGHPLSMEIYPGCHWGEAQVVQLLQEVLGILEVVHGHGLIHRDLKPSNLIRRERDEQLVLIDFGAVKPAWTQVVTDTEKTSVIFATGVGATIAIGTPGYMPAEQERGIPRTSSDIYALGRIALHALTGLSPTDLMEDSDTGEILWQQHCLVSNELAVVINKMVRYHFKERYQSASEALQALGPLIARYSSADKEIDTRSLASAMSSSEQENSFMPTVDRGDAVNKSYAHRFSLSLGLVIGVASILALIATSYYLFQMPAFNLRSEKSLASAVASKNSTLKNVSLVHTLKGHEDVVWSVASSLDSQTLVSSSGDKTIKVWNLLTGKLLRTLSGNSDYILDVALASGDRNLVSSSYATNNAINTWNLPAGELRPTVFEDAERVWSVAISPDGQTLASSNEDGTIKVWQGLTGQLRYNLVGHADKVWAVAISPDARMLASASSDETIKLWDLRTRETLHTFTGHLDRVRTVAFSPNGRTLVSGSWDKTIKIWDLPNRKLLRTLSGHSGYINSVAISPDGQTIASASDDRTIKLWSRDGKLLRTLTGHLGNVNSVSFNHNGTILISGSGDKTIKIWRLNS